MRVSYVLVVQTLSDHHTDAVRMRAPSAVRRVLCSCFFHCRFSYIFCRPCEIERNGAVVTGTHRLRRVLQTFIGLCLEKEAQQLRQQQRQRQMQCNVVQRVSIRLYRCWRVSETRAIPLLLIPSFLPSLWCLHEIRASTCLVGVPDEGHKIRLYRVPGWFPFFARPPACLCVCVLFYVCVSCVSASWLYPPGGFCAPCLNTRFSLANYFPVPAGRGGNDRPQRTIVA